MTETDIQSCHSHGKKSKFFRPQITMMGAMAMSGMVWLAITNGSRPCSSRRHWANASAMTMPITRPTKKPAKASRRVKTASSSRMSTYILS